MPPIGGAQPHSIIEVLETYRACAVAAFGLARDGRRLAQSAAGEDLDHVALAIWGEELQADLEARVGRIHTD